MNRRLIVRGALVFIITLGSVSVVNGTTVAEQPRREIPWAALNCPASDQRISITKIDAAEIESKSARRAVAPVIAEEAPELVLEAKAAKDVAPRKDVAEFPLRDTDGFVVARFRAEEIEGAWAPSGWIACASVA